MKTVHNGGWGIALRYALLGAIILMALSVASADVALSSFGDTYTISNGFINYTINDCDYMETSPTFSYWNDTSGTWSRNFPLYYAMTGTIERNGVCIVEENSTDRVIINRTNYANHTIKIILEDERPWIKFEQWWSASSNNELLQLKGIDADMQANWKLMFFGFNDSITSLSAPWDYTEASMANSLENNWIILWSDQENTSLFAWSDEKIIGGKVAGARLDAFDNLNLFEAVTPEDWTTYNNTLVFGVMPGLPTGVGATDTDGDSVPDAIDNDTADYSPYYQYFETFSYITNCSGREPVWEEVFNLATYDEGSDTDLILTDIEIGFTPLYSNGTDIRDIGVDSNGLDTHEYCIFPEHTRILYDAHVQTDTTGYYPRDYFYNNASMEYPGIETTNLYLINETQGDQIAIHVRDENLNDRAGAEVRVLRWLPPSYTTVSILYTNSEGKAYLAVDRDEWYKFQVLADNVLYLTTDPTQLQGKDTTSNPYVIDVTFGDTLGYFTWVSGISYDAYWNSATEIYTFVVSDGTGEMTSGSIAADQMNLTGQARVCWTNSTSASFTITCDLSAQTNGTYNLKSWLVIGGDSFLVHSDIIYIGAPSTQLTNQDGLIMSFIFIGTIAMAGIIHPIIMVLFTILGLIAVGVLQLSLIGLEYILPLVFVGIIMIYIMRRK